MDKSTNEEREHQETIPGAEDDQDVEGHSLLLNPIIRGELIRARESDIRRDLQARERELEAKRPHKK
jgi:hypothetical protein